MARLGSENPALRPCPRGVRARPYVDRGRARGVKSFSFHALGVRHSGLLQLAVAAGTGSLFPELLPERSASDRQGLRIKPREGPLLHLVPFYNQL